jgi:hypothetical protein
MYQGGKQLREIIHLIERRANSGEQTVVGDGTGAIIA